MDLPFTNQVKKTGFRKLLVIFDSFSIKPLGLIRGDSWLPKLLKSWRLLDSRMQTVLACCLQRFDFVQEHLLVSVGIHFLIHFLQLT